MCRRVRRAIGGYILEDLLIVMILTAFLIPVIAVSLQVSGKSLHFTETVQDEIAMAQMKKILILSEHYDCSAGTLLFEYQGDPAQMVFMNRHLIMKPGTQIFLSDLDEAVFFERNEMIYLSYRRNETEMTRCLIHE
jgi:hypothetical protein